MTTLTAPTRRDEAWRYADIDAVAARWPLPPAERLVVAADTPLQRTLVEDAGAIRQIDLTLEPGARARIDLLHTGAGYGRVELTVRLEEGADFALHAAQVGAPGAVLEIVTRVTHAGPDATSRQVVRSVLGARATGTYLGKVAVAPGAQGTDSEQAVRAMLLDRTATANAVPQLDILADDVKCAHGAAIGELDAGALFYLASRGLDPAAAKHLLLHAFVAEAFDDAAEAEMLTTRALAALEGLL